MTMPWLHPLCTKIVAMRELPEEQRTVSVLWASELAGICDRWVPLAPTLQLDMAPTEDYPRAPELRLSWFWQAQHRTLTLTVDHEGRVDLLLLDAEAVQDTENPAHEVVKRSVQCFFEGWAPSNEEHP
jgi:hypothetical protein